MKKFFTAALLAVTLTTSAFAADITKVNNRIIRSFNMEFANATDVSWSVKPTFTKATFTLQDKRVDAFYDYAGNMLGCSYAISLDELPTSAKRAFAKKFADYTVKEAIQFDAQDETAFYISAENDKQSVVLKVVDGFLSTYKKTNKN